ncbi:hypothetical protein [Lysinibacillus irui]|uniref:hypothetical protein n=1 Tax=Lysinibacillus irui TaxID=2998077 RepID=UPI002AD57373|nr:hypothetical protein [Lysinibacillus irui]MEA0562221.1 hypothetical protein [Lysinibacillus irui]
MEIPLQNGRKALNLWSTPLERRVKPLESGVKALNPGSTPLENSVKPLHPVVKQLNPWPPPLQSEQQPPQIKEGAVVSYMSTISLASFWRLIQ